LIFRIETLREELEENPSLEESKKSNIQNQISQYVQQLDKHH
jgi:hypothetical protein